MKKYTLQPGLLVVSLKPSFLPGRKRIQTFGMMKYLTKHIIDPDKISQSAM